MISFINGTVERIKPTEVLISASGVGYSLAIPFTTFEHISGSKTVSLEVVTLLKEEQFRLFGFATEEEKQVFLTLISVSGVGPAMALSLLSGLSIAELVAAVDQNNLTILTRVPGIGKTKAEKLIFELRRRLPVLKKYLQGPLPESKSDVSIEAMEALKSLGYDDKTARSVVEKVQSEDDVLTLESVIRQSLRLLG